MPDPIDVINAAQGHGWEAVLVAFVMLSAMAALAYLARTWMADTWKREERMACRIDKLEDFQRGQLLDMVGRCQVALDDNSAAMREFTSTLHERMCLLSPERVKDTLGMMALEVPVQSVTATTSTTTR